VEVNEEVVGEGSVKGLHDEEDPVVANQVTTSEGHIVHNQVVALALGHVVIARVLLEERGDGADKGNVDKGALHLDVDTIHGTRDSLNKLKAAVKDPQPLEGPIFHQKETCDCVLKRLQFPEEEVPHRQVPIKGDELVLYLVELGLRYQPPRDLLIEVVGYWTTYALSGYVNYCRVIVRWLPPIALIVYAHLG
jgi:hypothetical protein